MIARDTGCVRTEASVADEITPTSVVATPTAIPGFMNDSPDNRHVFVVGPDAEKRRALGDLLQNRDFAAIDCVDANGLVDRLHGVKSGCVLVDISELRFDGLDGLADLRRRRPDVPVVLVAGSRQAASAVALLQSPNIDIVSCPDGQASVVLRSVENAFDSTDDAVDPADTLKDIKKDSLLSQLSPRERDVLILLVEGKQNKAVAHDLGISPRTVEVHRSRLMRRLNVSSFAELIRFALEAGVGKPQ